MVKRFTRQYLTWENAPVILTVSDACILLRMNETTLRKNLEKGSIPGAKFGRQWRLEKAEIQKMFCERSTNVPNNNTDGQNRTYRN